MPATRHHAHTHTHSSGYVRTTEEFKETELGEALIKSVDTGEVEIYLHIIHEMYATAYNKKSLGRLQEEEPRKCTHFNLVWVSLNLALIMQCTNT